MKEAIGGVSIFQIVIVFILLFAGIMCLTINHSRAFGVKDEIINIIESTSIGSGASSNELDSNTISQIVALLQESGYKIVGSCPSGFTGYNRDGNPDNNRSTFCVKANNVASSFNNNARQICSRISNCVVADNLYPKMVYYDVVLFYQLDIPLFSRAFSFQLKGSTKVVVG